MPHYPITKQKIIKYDSPSGRINIGKWLPPFEKFEGGYGFVGVLAEDAKTGQLQCHICGEWYEQLTTHIYAKHGLKSKEYCNQHGLFYSTALKSKRIRKIHSLNMLGMRKKHKKHRIRFANGNKESANRKGQGKPAEGKNKFGVCELQIIDKIKKLKDKLGRTPALTELMDEYGGGFSTNIRNCYGGYLQLLRKLNYTPVTSSRNPKYSKKYFVDKGIMSVIKGKKLTGKSILNASESRHMYNYFSSKKIWKKKVIKELNNMTSLKKFKVEDRKYHCSLCGKNITDYSLIRIRTYDASRRYKSSGNKIHNHYTLKLCKKHFNNIIRAIKAGLKS